MIFFWSPFKVAFKQFQPAPRLTNEQAGRAVMSRTCRFCFNRSGAPSATHLLHVLIPNGDHSETTAFKGLDGLWVSNYNKHLYAAIRVAILAF